MTYRDIYGSTILIVDDNEFNIVLLEQILSREGFRRIEVARDGHEALKKTRMMHPDLVVLDLLMPNMSGIEYCRAVRADKACEHMPILVQTIVDEKEALIEAYKAGVSDFITKPVHKEELVARCKVHLERQLLIKKLTGYHSRVHKDLELARGMQMALVPGEEDVKRLTERYGVELASHFTPSDELGGDIWGFRELDDHRFLLFSVDFSGHGIASAINTFRLNILLHSLPYQEGIEKQVAYLNLRLREMLATGQYATMFYALMDVKARRMEYVLAGAPPPFFCSAAAVEHLEGKGVPMGVSDDPGYRVYERSFAPGDSLTVYSDALTEMQGDEGKWFDAQQALAQLARRKGGLTPGKAVDGLLRRFREHCGGAEVKDDLTLVALRF